MIDYPNFLQETRRNIERYGVHLVGVADSVHCGVCGTDDCADHKDAARYDKPGDGFVYTIGHRERARPDLVVLCGPRDGEQPVPGEALNRQISEATMLLNDLVDNWGENPVLAGQHCAAGNGRVYRVCDDPALVQEARESLTVQAGRYYGCDDYRLLVLVPVGWMHAG